MEPRGSLDSNPCSGSRVSRVLAGLGSGVCGIGFMVKVYPNPPGSYYNILEPLRPYIVDTWRVRV